MSLAWRKALALRAHRAAAAVLTADMAKPREFAGKAAGLEPNRLVLAGDPQGTWIEHLLRPSWRSGCDEVTAPH